jgi:hypothetical protein
MAGPRWLGGGRGVPNRTASLGTGGGQPHEIGGCSWTTAVDPDVVQRLALITARRGRAQANGSDRINAHAASRFLRAFCCLRADEAELGDGRDDGRGDGPARRERPRDGRDRWDRRDRRDRRAIIRAVTPLLLGAAGVLALVAGGLVLRTFGAAYRIGRLLATTPAVTVAEAAAIATEGRHQYVRVTGRIDAQDEFEDADHRPLVFRRTRLEARAGRGWRAFEDQRDAVPFTINEGLDAIAIDPDALGEGLVVVPRESSGRAADLGDRAPAGLDPETPVRARIEQISSVEHAIAIGYPVAIDPGGTPGGPGGTPGEPGGAGPGPEVRLTAARGRPLILTVLEPDEAMRILAGGDAGRTRLAAALLGTGAVLLAAAAVWALVGAVLPAVIDGVPSLGGLVPVALAASTEPTPGTGGDPRSNGQGPGLVGTPGLAILGVLAIAVLAIVATTVYVRLTTPPGEREARRSGTPGSSARRRDGRSRRR